jgi:hypothetical protein
MKTPRFILLLLFGFWLAPRGIEAEQLPVLVIFDKNDPAGADYYDASFGLAENGSELVMGGQFRDKLVIDKTRFRSNEESGKIEFRSVSGGRWELFIASPGWQTRNASDYDHLEFWLSALETVPGEGLPAIGLESSTNIKTPLVKLADYLPGGVSSGDGWTKVVIPLADFEPFGGFRLNQFKAARLAQEGASGVTYTLWIDDLKLMPESEPEPDPEPARPLDVRARAGDRSVVLHWEGIPQVNLGGYHVYRAGSAEGPFVRLTETPVPSHSYGDAQAMNGASYFYRVHGVNARGESAGSELVGASPAPFENDDDFLDYAQYAAFAYFWREANPENGLIRDRSQPFSAASIAAVGFGLTGIGIGIDRGWITREEGSERTAVTLRALWEKEQGIGETGASGYKGWFYHFLEMDSAARAGSSELSSIDTALLLAGVLFAREYFSGDGPVEEEIRELAGKIFDRVDWQWMADGEDSLTHGWRPESGFLPWRWTGYNEAMILYIMGLGAAVNPLPPSHWESWTSSYQWETHYGQSFVIFPPLFGHQYSHAWIDFRHIADAYMREKGITYFENSRRATLAQRLYAIENPGGFEGYGELVWGFTACDGPGTEGFFPYIARGAPPPEHDDGTIAPTAIGGSMPFAPEICLPSFRHLYEAHRTSLWTGYGFRDAFNLTANWWGPDVIGIDQGTILLMIENYRAQRVWRVFMGSPEIQRGLERAGFTPVQFVSPGIRKEESGVLIEWDAAEMASYQVEYSANLDLWLHSPTGFLVGTASRLEWKDDGPPATDKAPEEVGQRFYRVFEIEQE